MIRCYTTRIIPAGAGKRAGAAAEEFGSGDHPRGCGEKRASMALLA